MATPKIVITGGPHTGKTTLIEALKPVFPRAYFISEPATNVIQHELDLEKREPSHVLRVPWVDFESFEWLVADECERLEAAIPPDVPFAIQDRGLVDTIAYASLNGLKDYTDVVRPKIKAAAYTVALMCEPVGEYATTTIRSESVQQALKLQDVIKSSYDEIGIPVIELPPVDINSRVELVTDCLQGLGLYDHESRLF